jgi:hypothetical protein
MSHRRLSRFVLLAASFTATASAQNKLWIRQLGTSADDRAYAASADGSGGSYLTGHTTGSLGAPNAGGFDAWLARFNGWGDQLWIRQIGSNAEEFVRASAPDGSGGFYLSGHTIGSLAAPNIGAWDAFLARYDGAGNQLWIRQFGTNRQDFSASAAQDGSGGTYVSGHTEGSVAGPNAGDADMWLARYDAAGNQLWIRQIGTTAYDSATAAAANGSDGVYVSGLSYDSLGGPNAGGADVWLARYDGAGNQLWIRHLGTGADDLVDAAAPDGSGGVFVGGASFGGLGGTSAGDCDVWLARYDGAGNQLWIQALGTAAEDFAFALVPHGSDGVFVSGYTGGDLGGPSSGFSDGWLAHFDGAGALVWIRQLGSSSYDFLRCAAPDGSGGVFVGGSTSGNFGGPQAGIIDAWLARYDGSGSCSSVAYCTALVSSSGCLPVLQATGSPDPANPQAFVVDGTSLESAQNGLLFFGTTGQAGTPFSRGWLCVDPPLYRLPVKNSGGAAACSGALSYTLADYLAHPNGGALIVAGASVFSQLWYRDPPSAFTVGLTAGLEFVVCP